MIRTNIPVATESSGMPPSQTWKYQDSQGQVLLIALGNKAVPTAMGNKTWLWSRFCRLSRTSGRTWPITANQLKVIDMDWRPHLSVFFCFNNHQLKVDCFFYVFDSRPLGQWFQWVGTDFLPWGVFNHHLNRCWKGVPIPKSNRLIMV